MKRRCGEIKARSVLVFVWSNYYQAFIKLLLVKMLSSFIHNNNYTLWFLYYLKHASPTILSFSIRVRFSLLSNVLGEIAKPNLILLGNDSTIDSISVKSSLEDATTSFVHSQPLLVMICGHINQRPLNAPRIKKKRFLIIVKS